MGERLRRAEHDRAAPRLDKPGGAKVPKDANDDLPHAARDIGQVLLAHIRVQLVTALRRLSRGKRLTPVATFDVGPSGGYDASVMPKDTSSPNRSSAPNDTGIERVVDSYGRFHAWLAKAHVPDFLELNLTLAQLRTLYLVTASGPMSMSHVAERLGTAPSTATGVVDGLVQLGLLERTEDPSDRRQVVVGPTPGAHDRLEDFSELSRRRLRELLAHIQSNEDLVTVERAIDLLTDAAASAERNPS